MSEEIRCFGCGAIIQSEDENKIGFVPKKALNNGYNAKYIYNFAGDIIEPKYDFKQKKDRFLFVGRLDVNKNPLRLIKIFEKIKKATQTSKGMSGLKGKHRFVQKTKRCYADYSIEIRWSDSDIIYRGHETSFSLTFLFS